MNPVSINSFSATIINVDTGSATSLLWTTSNADSCTLDEGQGETPAILDAQGLGSREVSPTSTTTYTLSCSGESGPVVETLDVTVASLDSFTSDVPIVAEGDSVNLSWSGENLGECKLNNVVVTGVGSVQTPMTAETYTLACEGFSGPLAERHVDIVVVETPTLEATEEIVSPTGQTTLSWNGVGSSLCVLKSPSGEEVFEGDSEDQHMVEIVEFGDWTIECTGDVNGTTATSSATITIHVAVSISDAVAHVAGVMSPEVVWTHVGAVSCTVDGMTADVDQGGL
ncbi:MAG: hypothetical protein GY814_17615, partial [Gammaproteobacteria bacterium]|nr:hypothetical protein [Gammaproteobacteria bacterium]